jgi:hypothetical protein
MARMPSPVAATANARRPTPGRMWALMRSRAIATAASAKNARNGTIRSHAPDRGATRETNICPSPVVVARRMPA